jgi:hypothetical protein
MRLVKATWVHLFLDEKMTKPATAYEEFDEAFWNDDTATVIRDEPSDKLSESRNSFRWPRPASPSGGTEGFVPMWKMHGVRHCKRGRVFQPNAAGKGRTPKAYSAQSHANSPPAHRQFYDRTT